MRSIFRAQYLIILATLVLLGVFAVSTAEAQGVLSPRMLRQDGALDQQTLCWTDANGYWAPCTISGSGITSLNGLTGITQTFAKVDDTNVTVTINSTGTTHTWSLGWSGVLGLSRGGTGADLTLTGGANQFVRQNTLGGVFTVGAIVDADVPNSITIDLAAAATALASDPTDCTAGQYATAIAINGNLTCAQIAFSEISGKDHGALTGLTDDDHTQYALLLGRATGQTLIGGTGAGDDLTLQTTSNVSKGSYILSELTTNGLLSTTGGTGTLAVDTTDYEEEGQINATTVTGNAADDQVLLGSGASALAYATIPNCNTENMLTYTASTNTFGCESDTSGGGAGDSIEVEDGDNLGTFTPIDTTARFDDSGDINFTFADGGVGGPDVVTATVRADSVALTTDTTGNYTATIADAGNSTVTVVNGVAEGGAVTLDAVDLNCTDCIGPTEITDSYVLNSGDAITGNLDFNDGVGDTPAATFTPQTGTAFSISVEDTTDDLRITAATASTENIEFENTSTGLAAVFIETSDGVLTDLKDTAHLTTGTLADARVDGSLEADELVLAGDVDGTANANDLDEAAVEAELEAVLDLADLQEKDIDSLTGQSDWGTAATKTTANLTVSGVDVDYEGGASEGFPRLAQSTTPPSTACDAAGEAGRLYFDTDADTDGSVFVCRGATGWKEIDDDGGAGGGNAWTTIGTAVADIAGDTMTVTDSSTIDFTTTDDPEDLTAAIVGNSVGTAQVDETQGFVFSALGATTISAGNLLVDEFTATVNNDAIGVTSTDGIILDNTTAATSGNQQWSPRIRLTGQGWGVTPAASQTVDWVIENRPFQGTVTANQATANTRLVFSAQRNGGGYGNRVYMTDSGGNMGLDVPGGILRAEGTYTYTNTNAQAILTGVGFANPTASTAANYEGIGSFMQAQGAFPFTATFGGVRSIFSWAEGNQTSLIDEMVGIASYADVENSGNITNLRLFVAETPDQFSTGAFQNVYGLYVRNQTAGATNNWSIFTESGNAEINTGAAATVGLRIDGTTSQSANLQEWRDVTPTVVASVSPTGVINAASYQQGGAALNFSHLAGTASDAQVDGSLEADELVLAGDVDGTANANDLDEAAVEAELEAVLDLADLQEKDIDSLTGQDAIGTNFDFDDGTGDTPTVSFTPQTGTVFSLLVEDTTDDFRFTANTVSTENVEFENVGTGLMDVLVETSDGVLTSVKDAGSLTSGTLADARVDGSLEADELVLAGDVDGTANANDLDEAAVEAELEAVLDLADLQEKDIDSLTGQANWGTAATKETADLIINGVEVDFEAGAAEGYPRLAQSTTPPAADCDAANEAGRLYFDSDLDTDGSVVVCRGVAGWKDIDDDGGAGGGNAFGTIGTAVADAGSDTITVTDSSTIDFTTTDNPEDLTAIVIADSITATQVDETSAFAFSALGATVVAGSLTLNDGVGDSPSATWTPQTGTSFSMLVADADDDLRVTAATAATENVEFENTGTGVMDVLVETSDGVLTSVKAGESITSGTVDQARLDANVVMDNEGNTYSTGAQDFTSATSLTVPVAAGASPTANGAVAYDSTANQWEVGDGGVNRQVVLHDKTQTVSGKTQDEINNTFLLSSYVTYDAAGCQAGTGFSGFTWDSTDAPSAVNCIDGTNVDDGSISFADGVTDRIHGSFLLPPDFTTGNGELFGVWRSATASTNTVRFTLETRCVADGEVIEGAWNTAQNIDDAGKGTTLQTNSFNLTSVTQTGCAASEIFYWRFSRLGADAADTFAGSADLLQLRFRIRRSL